MRILPFRRTKTAPLRARTSNQSNENVVHSLFKTYVETAQPNLFALAEELRRLEKRAVRKQQQQQQRGSSTAFTHMMSGLVQRIRDRDGKPGRQSLFTMNLPRFQSQNKDDFAALLYAMDGYMHYVKTKEAFRGILMTKTPQKRKRFRLVRPVVLRGSPLVGVPVKCYEDGEESPRTEWRFDSTFQMAENDYRQQVLVTASGDFERILGSLKGPPISPLCDPLLVLPPPPEDDDEEEEKYTKVKRGRGEANQNSTGIGLNQNQANRIDIIGQMRPRLSGRLPAPELEYGCKLTLFGAYIALRVSDITSFPLNGLDTFSVRICF